MRYFRILSFLAALATIAIVSCEKNEIKYAVFDELSPNEARIKFNYNIAYGSNPGVQIKVNGQRVSPLLTSRYPFPGGGYNTLGDSRADYLRIAPGNQEVSVSIPKRGTLTDSVVLYKTNITTAAGNAYTLHLTDTAANTKSLLTQDDHSIPDSGFVRFRFVNLMPNVAAVDLYYGGVLVVGNIPYLKTSEYFVRPILTTAAVAWTIRPTGSAPTSAALATYTSANTFLNRRSYTIFATGYSGRTDAVRKPYVSFFLIK